MKQVYNDLKKIQSELVSHKVAGNGAPLALTIELNTKEPIKSNFEDKRFKH